MDQIRFSRNALDKKSFDIVTNLYFEFDNTDLNPISEYRPSIHKLGSGKNVIFGNVLAKQYVRVYYNGLGYFTKVGYLIGMGCYDHQNFEKKLGDVYQNIWWEVF
jgi:hypothetical protein